MRGIIWFFLVLIIQLYSVGSYVGNVVRLVQCDWSGQGSWKGEVVHAVGVFIPPVSLVTVWNGDK